MLNLIIHWSLRNRFLVLALALAIVGAGLWSVSQLNIDAFPDTTPVQVQINTNAPGLAPLETERQITAPIEQALSGLPRLEQVRSLSKFGLSQVTVTFADGTNVYFARQLVSERLGNVELAEGVPRPKLGPVATGLGEVFHYMVRSPTRDLTELRTIQDWVIRPPMRTVPGVAEINSWGGFEKQFQVRINPSLLLKYDLSADEVIAAVREGNRNVGGGHLSRGGSMTIVHGIARPQSTREIAELVIKSPRDGVPVRVGDVAEVMVGHDLPPGAVTAQGKGEVVLGLGFMLVGENSHEVTTRLKSRLEEVRPTLPPDVDLRLLYDRTQLVDQVIGTVRRNLFEGGLLVIAVLFVFLGNLRAGLLVALAIPLSMLFAFSGMLQFGIAGSLLSLGAIDFGLVVDSSVVLVENCVRHLSHDTDTDKSKLEVVQNAAVEVRAPTLFGELIILIVYLPVLTLEGTEGKLFRPMALTVIFALLGSMILSMTLMPVLASLLLPRKMDERDPWIVQFARWLYRPILRLALRNGLAILGLAVGAAMVGAMIVRGLGAEFIPTMSEMAFALNVQRLPGTDLRESLRYNRRMEELILANFPDEVEYIWSRIGTGEVATDPMGPEETDVFITLKPREKWTKVSTQDELREKMRDLLEPLPGQKVAFSQPIEQRLKEMISGVKAQVAVKLFGDDLDVLLAQAETVERVLKGIDGHADVSTEQVSGLPVLQVRVRMDQLARHGLTARGVLDRVESLGGRVIGDIVEEQLRFPLVVRMPRGTRSSPEQLAAVPITSLSGEVIPLGRLAEIKEVEGPAKLLREWGQRRVIVQCNVEGRDVASFVAEAQERVAKEVKFPSSRYRVVWSGDFENLQRAQLRLMVVVPLALMLIFALLYVTYRRLRDVLLVFTAVPFASVGGLLALHLREMPFSIPAGVGFVALSGVSVLNSMLLVTFLRQLQTRGYDLDRAIEESALTRLRPVLMTALVASVGFVPMALSEGVGAEVQRPLATVVIGGVISSTLLTLLVLPVLYHFFGGRAGEDEEDFANPEREEVLAEVGS